MQIGIDYFSPKFLRASTNKTTMMDDYIVSHTSKEFYNNFN